MNSTSGAVNSTGRNAERFLLDGLHVGFKEAKERRITVVPLVAFDSENGSRVHQIEVLSAVSRFSATSIVTDRARFINWEHVHPMPSYAAFDTVKRISAAADIFASKLPVTISLKYFPSFFVS